jgi:aryl-alcohol dehydrogenase-like predicted oxidoreductase
MVHAANEMGEVHLVRFDEANGYPSTEDDGSFDILRYDARSSIRAGVVVMGCSWERVPFGASDLRVTPLGLGSSYGLEARDIERAVERGINYIYWGSQRRLSYAEAVRNLGPAGRDNLVLVVQSYTRVASLMRASLEIALREMRTDYTDLLLLGWWNEAPPRGIVDAAVELKRLGLAKAILISCHHRPSFAEYIDDPAYDGIMVRYNAAHPGAETEVFPHLSRRRVGTVAYTATRWKALLNPKYLPANEPRPRASDCYRFVLSNPQVDVCLSGPANVEELDEAMAALDRGPLSADEMAWMRRVGQHVHKVANEQRFTKLVRVADRVVDWGSRMSHWWDK